MCSEPLPKEFEKATEVLPFTKNGLTTASEFRKAEEEVQKLEWLKKVGLTNDEIALYEENEGGRLDKHQKVEATVLQCKLKSIYNKIKEYSEPGSSKQVEGGCSTSKEKPENIFDRFKRNPMTSYPEGHPIHELKEIEESLFGHLKNDDIIPITKRRKILRRLDRKKERTLSQKKINIPTIEGPSEHKPGSLWDMKEMPDRIRQQVIEKTKKNESNSNDRVIGPRKQMLYSIKDNQIVRVNPVEREVDVPIEEDDIEEDDRAEDNGDNDDRPENPPEEERAEDIIMPEIPEEEQLLEGTKMSIDNIRKIDRFKDYEPGVPSKVLYLKNIAPSVTQEQLSLLFNQFVYDNGGPVDVRLMTGRMRGQAFVAFRKEYLCIQALGEINGTILSGQPIIAQFGRNSNRIHIEER